MTPIVARTHSSFPGQFAKQCPDSGSQRHVGRRSARSPKPIIEHLSGQAMLAARLMWFYDELVQPLWIVRDVFTRAETVNR